MRRSVRYRVLTIPNKIDCEIRLSFDDANRRHTQPEYYTLREEMQSTVLHLFPFFSIEIHRGPTQDEEGRWIRPAWNPNDSLSLTQFSLPIFRNEFAQMCEDMKTPNLFSYRGERLELNDKVAEKIRHVFVISSTTIELTAQKILKENDAGEPDELEGIKMKFNNEDSFVLLTINEMGSLLYSIDHMDMMGIALQLYTNYIKREIKPIDRRGEPPRVDIKPKFDMPEPNSDK